MSPQDLKTTVRQIVQAWNDRDLDALDPFYAPNVLCHRPPYPDCKDLVQLKRAYSDFTTAFPDCHFAIDKLIVEGDTAVAWITYRGTHTGQLGSRIPPTGKHVSGPGLIGFRFVEGIVVEAWDHWDELGFWQQLDYKLLPPHPETTE